MVDRLISAVVEYQHRQLQPLLHGGEQLGGVHEVRTVADNDKHFARGTFVQPDPERGRDLMAHA